MKSTMTCLAVWGLTLATIAQPALRLDVAADASLRLSWPQSASDYVAESSSALGAAAVWEAIATAPTLADGRWFVPVSPAAQARFYRLHQVPAPPTLARVTDTSPSAGETGVAVTRETVFRLSAPLADDAFVTTAELYATFGSRRLLGRPAISADRRTVTLFYLENLPPSARILVTFDGTRLEDVSGRTLDPDGNGQPGGVFELAFETAGVAGLAQTGVEGHVFASERKPDGANLPLANVTITVDGAEETLRTTTDATGAFRLQPAPSGRFFVHVDGRTAVGSQWPGGAYYPFVGKAWEAVAGKTNNLAGGTGDIFLPLIRDDTLQTVSLTESTRITFSSAVTATNPALAGVEIDVPANALFSENGARGGKVGVSAVPPDRLPEPLPPGLNLPIVITIQTDGPQNFDQPVPVRFPNLPDPNTGVKLGPGAKTVLWSFNHDTGRWEAQGTATVSADGNFAVTDPGVGVRQPGWHGVAPGLPIRLPPRAPTPDECSGDDCPPCVQTIFCPPQPTRKGKNYALCALECLGNVVDDLFGNKPKPQEGPSSFEMGLRCLGGPDKCPQKPEDTLSKERRDCMDRCRFPETKRLVYVVPCEGFYDPCQEDVGLQSTSLAAQAPPIPDRFIEQLRFWKVEGEFLTRLTGTPKIIENSQADVPKITAFFDAFADRVRADSPAGVHLSAAERAELVALPRPVQFTLQDWTTMIDRLDSLQGKPMPADVVAADHALTSLAELLQQRGWKHRLDGVVHGFLRLTRVRAPQLGSPEFPVRPHHFLIKHHESGFLLRGRLNEAAQFQNLVLLPENHYTIYYLDPVTGYAGAAFFVTPSIGETAVVPSAPLEPLDSEAVDTDGDGLSDLAELILGTSPNQPDSDGDGVSDGIEFREDANPLDGTPTALGAIALADTPGTAVDVVAWNDLAAVADSTGGIQLFDVANPLLPRRLSQWSVPGNSVVAVAGSGNLLVGAGSEGVTLLDIANPASPRLLRQVKLSRPARCVGLYPGLVITGSDRGQVSFLSDTGELLFETAVTNQPVHDVLVLNDVLYVLRTGSLASYSLAGELLGMVASPGNVGAGGRRLRLATDGTHLFASHTQGYNVFDTDTPLTPRLLRQLTTRQFGWKQIVPAGNGWALGAVDANSTDDGPHDVSLYAIGSSALETNLVATFPTPGLAAAVAFHRGLALVADGQAGLTVVNFLAREIGTNAPTIQLAARSSGNAAGAEAGAPLTLLARTTDDHLVRSVEFYVDDTRVGLDGNLPFSLDWRAPAKTNNAPSPVFTVRARATDTAGNATWSEAITLDLSRDQTPPSLRRTQPGLTEGFVLGDSPDIVATFDEAMDPGAVASGLRLAEAGADGLPETPDDVAVPAHVEAVDARTYQLFPDGSLPIGTYLVRLTTNATDLAGNALSRGAIWTFRIRPYLDFIAKTNGAWNNLAATVNSWSLGRLPTLEDFVRIHTANGSTVTVSRAVLAYDLHSITPLAFLDNTTLTLAKQAVFDGPVTIRSGTWNQGTVVFQGNTRLAASFSVRDQDWTNAGHLVLGPNINLNVRNQTLNRTTYRNLANAVWEFADSQFGVLNLGAGPADFVNEGRVIVHGTSRSYIGTSRFINLGSVEVESGDLELQAGNPNDGASQHLGSYRVDAGASLRFTGLSEFGRLSRIHGAGSVLLSATTFPGSYEVDGTNTINGTVNLTGSVRSRGPWLTEGGNLVFSGLNPDVRGPVVSEGTLTVSAQPRLTLDSLEVYADLVVNTTLEVNGPLRLDASVTPGGAIASARLLGTGRLRANGPAAFAGIVNAGGGGLLEIAGPARGEPGTILQFNPTGYALTIQPSGAFDLSGIQHITARGGVTNLGTLTKSDANTLQLTGGLRNRGSVRLTGGTLLVANANLVQSAGSLTLAGGTLRVGATTSTTADLSATFAGGVLEGAGKLAASSVTNAARLTPGSPIGLLDLDVGTHPTFSVYRQTAEGTLAVDLAGATPGTGHDQLRVSGRALLDGTLELRPAPGFAPPVGQEFVVLTAAQVVGRFATVVGTTLPDGHRLDVVYEPAQIKLRVAGP